MEVGAGQTEIHLVDWCPTFDPTFSLLDCMNILLEELRDWWSALLGSIPGRSGRFLRRLYYRAVLGGSGTRISFGERIEVGCPRNIILGNEVYFGRDCVLRACGGGMLTTGDRMTVNGNVRLIADFGRIEIGSDVLIGPNVVVRASNHETARDDVPIRQQGQRGGHVVIGDDVWIGANVVIVAGVTIGSHAVIGAGSVVNRNVPDFAFAAGVPARVISDRRHTSQASSGV